MKSTNREVLQKIIDAKLTGNADRIQAIKVLGEIEKDHYIKEMIEPFIDKIISIVMNEISSNQEVVKAETDFTVTVDISKVADQLVTDQMRSDYADLMNNLSISVLNHMEESEMPLVVYGLNAESGEITLVFPNEYKSSDEKASVFMLMTEELDKFICLVKEMGIDLVGVSEEVPVRQEMKEEETPKMELVEDEE